MPDESSRARLYLGRSVRVHDFDRWLSTKPPDLTGRIVRAFVPVEFPQQIIGKRRGRPILPARLAFFLLRLDRPHDLEVPGVALPESTRMYVYFSVVDEGETLNKEFSGVPQWSVGLCLIRDSKAVEGDQVRYLDQLIQISKSGIVTLV